MKKLRIIAAFVFLLTLLTTPQIAIAGERPALKSFTFSPQEVELTSVNNSVSIELAVTHPNGISNSNVQVTLSDGINNSISSTLYRTDSPENPKLTAVVFKGNIQIPRIVNPGAYFFSISDITNGSSAGYSYKLENFSAPEVRTLIGAENALLVRDNGKLNLDYKTFEGPAYDTLTSHQFINTTKYNSANSPIYKVGESYDPSNYFENYVPSLPLKMTTATPEICTTDGNTMKFINEGNCGFVVLTERNNDYREKKYIESATIGPAKIKQTLTINQVSNQDSTDLPKLIKLDQVYSSLGSIIFPESQTQKVCTASANYVRIISGGVCKLTYQARETTNYAKSEIYDLIITINRNKPLINLEIPRALPKNKTKFILNAKSNSQGKIRYESKTVKICEISDNTLILKNIGNCKFMLKQEETTTFEYEEVEFHTSLIPPVLTKCIKNRKNNNPVRNFCK